MTISKEEFEEMRKWLTTPLPDGLTDEERDEWMRRKDEAEDRFFDMVAQIEARYPTVFCPTCGELMPPEMICTRCGSILT
jgi:uncharacterized OB-fold protein